MDTTRRAKNETLRKTVRALPARLFLSDGFLRDDEDDDVWKDDDDRERSARSLSSGFSKEPDTRKIFEDEFADRLRARGVDATASRKIVTDAEMPDKDVVIGNIR